MQTMSFTKYSTQMYIINEGGRFQEFLIRSSEGAYGSHKLDGYLVNSLVVFLIFFSLTLFFLLLDPSLDLFSCG